MLLINEYGKGYTVDNLEKIRKVYFINEHKISELMFRKSLHNLLYIKARNHTFGDLIPSAVNKRITQKIKAGKQPDIKVLDHVIITS